MITRLLLALPLVTAGWIGILAGVMLLGGPAPAAMVILPGPAFLEHLPPGVSIVARGPYSVTLRGEADLVGALYAAGATLVLPAGLTGCLAGTGTDRQQART